MVAAPGRFIYVLTAKRLETAAAAGVGGVGEHEFADAKSNGGKRRS
jgi:hypothetical protein